MPGSEGKRELGGLARSIDALFSGGRSAAAPPGPPEPVESGMDVSDTREPTAAPPGDHGEAEVLDFPADLEIVPEPTTLPPADRPTPAEPEHRQAAADVESPGDLAWDFSPESGLEPDGVEQEAVAEEAWVEAPDVAGRRGAVVEPSHAQDASAEEEGPAEEELADAVGAFLSGMDGAPEQVERVAAALRERLALDPLADAVERLVDAAGDPWDEAILEMARTVINPAVASRLVQRMGRERDEDELARYTRLCRALGRVMANSFRGALTDSTDEQARRVYCDALIAMGETSRPVIEEMVGDDNRFLVRNAVSILGEIGGSRAVELVTSALADTDARVRREALLSIGKLGDDEAGQLVLGFTEDPDPQVRVAAATAAGQLGLQRALRPVLGMLADEDDPDVCVSLLGALGQMGDPGAVQSIEKHAVGGLFSKPRTDVRVAAYRALHAIGTPHARELLEQAKEDKDRSVRIAVREITKED
jgi:HEAT repeats/PBS lyase HEAT-like repeat